MPKKPGRPRSKLTKRYPVRHNEKMMRAWQAAAAREGRTLQNWMQHTLNEKAGRLLP